MVTDTHLYAAATPEIFMACAAMVLLMLGVFYFMLFRGGRKDKKAREEMLNAVAKNDRVLTIGGIVGTVVSVRDDEVVIKVDESTNTKITIVRSAMRKVLAPDEKLQDTK